MEIECFGQEGFLEKEKMKLRLLGEQCSFRYKPIFVKDWNDLYKEGRIDSRRI